MNGVRENRRIETLVRAFTRSPEQLNGLHEADAELIPIPGTNQLLALTTDAVVEEIESGLYDDPFLIGWMAVTAALSDLAAVGAEPLGVLVAESIPPGADVDRLQDGIRAACEEHGVHVLGGDTNESSHLQVAGVAVGTVPAGVSLTRLGAAAGQGLFATGLLGGGSVFAVQKMLGSTTKFRPVARIEVGRRLRGLADCCIDTSDGALAALDQLMRLNGVGFRLDDPGAWLHPGAVQLAHDLGVPPWMMLAGLHGDFELLFCASADNVPAGCMRIGTVTPDPCVAIHVADGILELDTGSIRNLFGSNIPALDELIQQIHACTRIID